MGAVFGRICVLRQRRRAVRGGAREAARDGRAVGRARARALRRRGRAPPPLPLRRAGQLARADRGAAGEQRAADRARGAGGDARPQRPRPGDPAPGLERGARAAAARGTSSGRCGSSRCSPTRPTCSSTPTSSRARNVMDGLVAELLEGAREEMARVAEQGGAVEAVPYMKAALVESHRERIAPDRVRRAGDGRRQPLRGDRAVAADRRTAGSWWSTRPSSRRRATRSSAWRASATATRSRRARGAAPRRGERREHHAGHDRRRPRGRDDRRVGGRAARGVRLLPRRRPASARPPRRPSARSWPSCATRSSRVGEALGRTAEDPGRQARARRALQRRRADRRAGARRRHGRRLRGHPPHTRPDRPLGGRRGRPRDRPLDPVRLAPRADPRRDRGAAADGATSRSWSAASSPRPTSPALQAAGVAAVYTPKDFEITRILRDDRRDRGGRATAYAAAA